MRASQRQQKRERERERKRRERKREQRRTRTTYAYVCLCSSRLVCVYICVQYIRFFAVSVSPAESLPYAVSLARPSPSICPSQIGCPFLCLSCLLSLPHSIYPSISVPPVAHITERRCICGPRTSVRLRARICARRPHGDRERGFGWI